MALEYRKRIKIMPGVHVNLSKSGISTSFGPKGFKVNTSKRGTYLRTSIPNTGIYSRDKISNEGIGCLIPLIVLLSIITVFAIL